MRKIWGLFNESKDKKANNGQGVALGAVCGLDEDSDHSPARDFDPKDDAFNPDNQKILELS